MLKTERCNKEEVAINFFCVCLCVLVIVNVLGLCALVHLQRGDPQPLASKRSIWPFCFPHRPTDTALAFHLSQPLLVHSIDFFWLILSFICLISHSTLIWYSYRSPPPTGKSVQRWLPGMQFWKTTTIATKKSMKQKVLHFHEHLLFSNGSSLSLQSEALLLFIYTTQMKLTRRLHSALHYSLRTTEPTGSSLVLNNRTAFLAGVVSVGHVFAGCYDPVNDRGKIDEHMLKS